MIQLGPLELNSVTLETPLGVSSADEIKLSTGRIQRVKDERFTLRLKVRLEKADSTYRQLVELVRNDKIVALLSTLVMDD